MAALDMGDLAEARRQIVFAISPTTPADPLWADMLAHPAEAASLRTLYAEARGDLAAARDLCLQVARSDRPGLRLCARRALRDLCPSPDVMSFVPKNVGAQAQHDVEGRSFAVSPEGHRHQSL